MPNWKWPQTKRNNKAPWYTIIRRSVFFIPIWTTLFLFLFFVFLGWGKDTTLELWDEIL